MKPPVAVCPPAGVVLVPPPPAPKDCLKYSIRCPSVLLSPGPLLCDDLAPMSNHLKYLYRQGSDNLPLAIPVPPTSVAG